MATVWFGLKSIRLLLNSSRPNFKLNWYCLEHPVRSLHVEERDEGDAEMSIIQIFRAFITRIAS